MIVTSRLLSLFFGDVVFSLLSNFCFHNTVFSTVSLHLPLKFKISLDFKLKLYLTPLNSIYPIKLLYKYSALSVESASDAVILPSETVVLVKVLFRIFLIFIFTSAMNEFVLNNGILLIIYSKQ